MPPAASRAPALLSARVSLIRSWSSISPPYCPRIVPCSGAHFPPRGPLGWFRRFSGTLKHSDFLPSFPRRFVAFASRYRCCTLSSLPRIPGAASAGRSSRVLGGPRYFITSASAQMAPYSSISAGRNARSTKRSVSIVSIIADQFGLSARQLCSRSRRIESQSYKFDARACLKTCGARPTVCMASTIARCRARMLLLTEPFHRPPIFSGPGLNGIHVPPVHTTGTGTHYDGAGYCLLCTNLSIRSRKSGQHSLHTMSVLSSLG